MDRPPLRGSARSRGARGRTATARPAQAEPIQLARPRYPLPIGAVVKQNFGLVVIAIIVLSLAPLGIDRVRARPEPATRGVDPP
jgi:hypothetical protein